MGITRISILCHDVSDNALGRAYILARVLQRRYRVTIIGPKFYRDRIWPPCDTGEVAIESIRGTRHPGWLVHGRRLFDLVRGSDVVYAVKARPTSFGVGLWAQKHLGCPLVLDIDDWEVGGYLDYPTWRRWLLAANLSNPNGYTFTRWMEHRVREADTVTTVSTFLQSRYGGILVPHGRDRDLFDPTHYDGASVRQQHGLPLDMPLLLFLGTPRRHKGLDTLLQTLERMGSHSGPQTVHTVIAGVDWTHPQAKTIADRASQLPLTMLGMQPFAEVPALLAAADMVVVPQSSRPFSQGQIPAKLIDAMAMAKPIVASAVSDIPAMLDGCGLTVPPEDPEALANAIETLLSNRALGEALGVRARQRFLERYTWDAMAEMLLPLIDQVLR